MRHVVYDASEIVLLAGWGILAAAWVAGAARTQGARPGPKPKDTASRVAGAVAIAVLLSPGSLWRPLAVTTPWLRVAAIPVLAAAAAFALWARLSLGRMWSSAAVARPDHELRTGGPYRITRHPIYTGMLGMLLGSVLAEGAGRWLVIGAAVAIALVVKARAEESVLRQAFPDRYPQYRRAVPALVPRLRRGG
jgi:protein-S-isoprenylcysteine O-methyltransferase Ste14